MMIYMIFQQCEKHFENRQPDFVTMILFVAVMTMFYGWLADEHVALESPFTFAVIYVWCKLVPDAQMSLWGFPVKSANLPWVLIAMHVLMGGSPFKDLVGVAAGHSYIFLVKVLPESHGITMLKTPKSIEKLVQRVNAYFEDPVVRGNGRIYNLNNDGRQANVGDNRQQ